MLELLELIYTSLVSCPVAENKTNTSLRNNTCNTYIFPKNKLEKKEKYYFFVIIIILIIRLLAVQLIQQRRESMLLICVGFPIT